MSLITATELGKSFGPVDIFSNISLSIPHRARIGLVGPNGVGKTTLLRILIGLEEPSEGEVQRARNLCLGYLPQEAFFESEGTLWDEVVKPFAGLRALQTEMAALEHAMADPSRAEEALAAYGKLQIQFDHQGGYTYELRIRQTLTGLGFTAADEQRPMSQLSGGQRTRVLLARLLLSEPDVLLMDEPTNHLDIAAIEWLEDFLADWPGAVLIVSHDRYFLDRVTNTIWEMTPSLELYHGNYSAFLQQREERYARRLEEYEAQQAFIQKEEEYIRRNIAGQNTRQAQGRQKRLERMLEEARLTPPHINAQRLHLRLEPASRSGDLVIRTRGLSVGYADEGRPLFNAPDLTLTRGECAAVIGPNGAGKTTFLKTLLEQIPPYEGEVVMGASLQIGYFAQTHEGLHPDWTLMEEIEHAAPNLLPGAIRDYLAKFLFTGDEVFHKVETLSGGERSRLALSLLALRGANLLLLDEPTNHLDLPSQEVLQSILDNFKGTILLVSHDRYLIDALATQIWEVMPDSGRLKVFDGNYSQYKEFRQYEAERAALAALTNRPQEQAARPIRPSGPSKDQLRRRQKKLEALEAEITELEQQLAALTRQLETPTRDLGLVQKLGHEYTLLHKKLEDRMETWARLSADQYAS